MIAVMDDKPATKDDLAQIEAARLGDAAAIAAVVESSSKLVYAISRKYSERTGGLMTVEEVASLGFEGLIESIQTFDASVGVKFNTYAVCRVRGRILDGMREEDRLPRLARWARKRLDQVSHELAAEHGRAPTADEVLDVAEIPATQLAGLRDAEKLASARSVERSMMSDNESQSREKTPGFADPKSVPPSARMEVDDFWRRLCAGLGKKERLILLGYYRQDLTMKEIADSLGLSESRVSQMHSSLIELLRQRNPSEAAKLPARAVAPAKKRGRPLGPANPKAEAAIVEPFVVQLPKPSITVATSELARLLPQCFPQPEPMETFAMDHDDEGEDDATETEATEVVAEPLDTTKPEDDLLVTEVIQAIGDLAPQRVEMEIQSLDEFWVRCERDYHSKRAKLVALQQCVAACLSAEVIDEPEKPTRRSQVTTIEETPAAAKSIDLTSSIADLLESAGRLRAKVIAQKLKAKYADVLNTLRGNDGFITTGAGWWANAA